MRRFLTATCLVALVSTTGACAGTTGTTTSPGASPAIGATAAPPASAPASAGTATAGNSQAVCTSAKTLINDSDLDALGQQLGALATAHQTKNADAQATAEKAIKNQAGTWAQELGQLQQQADDPGLRTTLGELSTSLTALASTESLDGVKSVEQAGLTVLTLGTGLDKLKKACG
ncbi:hypothetical protein Ait01nite_014940 [Actinoplanes italicus]|uniref:Uncharacterized protein n=1 Tax=Actinoplanes italicus TaxID=113567 RepID=A0A2T0KI57_9ACTN|nr:hypothetical protein [Actinoplanes italicus]PRX22927.1 hypothetical protein CLV67_104455 [Actinoplanes italicus]GIE28449.1 hypothetical protein Ait01nite_014940 [Actinoplanes italicus]